MRENHKNGFASSDKFYSSEKKNSEGKFLLYRM